MKTQLLCTFANNDNVEDVISSVKKSQAITQGYVYVLYSVSNDNDLYVTYNVDMSVKDAIPYETILIHRKKETNTIYTINALNLLIKQSNDGVLDMRYEVNWNKYRNCMLLTNNFNIKRVDTKIKQVVAI